LSVAAGLDPASLLELDGVLFDELELAAANRWGTLEELLATVAELVHLQWVTYLAAHSKRGRKLPTPLRITRPGADGEMPKTPKLSPLAFALEYGAGASSSSSSRNGG